MLLNHKNLLVWNIWLQEEDLCHNLEEVLYSLFIFIFFYIFIFTSCFIPFYNFISFYILIFTRYCIPFYIFISFLYFHFHLEEVLYSLLYFHIFLNFHFHLEGVLYSPLYFHIFLYFHLHQVESWAEQQQSILPSDHWIITRFSYQNVVSN